MPRCLKKEVSQRYIMPPYNHLQKLNICVDYMVWDLPRDFDNAVGDKINNTFTFILFSMFTKCKSKSLTPILKH